MLTASGLALPCLADPSGDHDGRWPIRDQGTIQKSFHLSGPPMRIVIDNVDGYVHVKGVSGSEVRLTAHRTIRAESDSDLEDARKEVDLETTEKPGWVSFYYAAPWRCNGESHSCHGDQRRFYNVTYDIDVDLPQDANIIVSTVNHGDVRVENAAGHFEVKNINGGISMTDIAGSGEVADINGPITVKFTKNPSEACSFHTLNGQLDVYFQPGLSADLLFKTFNGQIFTDFDVTARAAAVPDETESKNGKFVFHGSRFAGGRVGRGGPELRFDAFNGNVRLHQSSN